MSFEEKTTRSPQNRWTTIPVEDSTNCNTNVPTIATSSPSESDDTPHDLKLTRKPTDKYKFRKAIARGGMKSILRVKDSDTDREVAMATLADLENVSSAEASRFIQEARITAKLEHPNIVPIHDIGMDSNDIPYFTMKCISGHTLAHVLKQLKIESVPSEKKVAKGIPSQHKPDTPTLKLQPKKETPGSPTPNNVFTQKYNLIHLLQIFHKICDAIDFAHSKGVVHLDLKPENIQVGDYGEVLVLDWGLAKKNSAKKVDPIKKRFRDTAYPPPSFAKDATLTEDGEIKGTPGFMAPEQALGKNDERDQRTDIYSLGAILYNILTLERPLVGKDIPKMLGDTVTGNIPPPSQRSPKRDIPDSLEAITLKAMSVFPEDRYQTVGELIADLDAFTSGYATSAEEAGVFRHAVLWAKRHKAETTIASVVCAAILAIILIWLNVEWKRYGTWGQAQNITPKDNMTLNRHWTAKRGTWLVENGRLQAVPGNGDFFEIYFNQPVYGNLALEFDAQILTPDALKQSGDLSVVIADSKDSRQGYFFQTGGISNTSAVIKKREGFSQAVDFPLVPNQTYHIRVEKEGDQLRLYCDGKLLLSVQDIFYLEGGRIGFYTYGAGKEFWNIKLYHKGLPELVSPLLEGDAFYRESKLATGDRRTTFLNLARDAYTRVHASHPNKALGRKALMKRAYVNLEQGHIEAAKYDCALINHSQSPTLSRMMLESELAFRQGNLNIARAIFSDAFKKYPMSQNETAGFLLGKLTLDLGKQMPKDLWHEFWRLCATHQAGSVFRCRNKAIDSLAFLKGTYFRLLDCSGNNINDLSPLTGMNLCHLDCAKNKIADLSPLKDMNLEVLECFGNPISSVEPLRGLPLRELALHDCPKGLDLSPLAECEGLEKLTLPRDAKNIESLKSLPRLQYLDYEWNDGWTGKTADEFWVEYDKQKP